MELEESYFFFYSLQNLDIHVHVLKIYSMGRCFLDCIKKLQNLHFYLIVIELLCIGITCIDTIL